MSHKRNYIHEMTLEDMIITARDCEYVIVRLKKALRNKRSDSTKATRVVLNNTLNKMMRNIDELRLKMEKKLKVSKVNKGVNNEV